MSGFVDKQIRALSRSVGQRHIQTRSAGGKELSYIEGWFAIAEANRIFGFDGWDRETIEAKCIHAREVGGAHSVCYTARVRITVRPGDRIVVRDGCGTGEGRADRLSEAHDLALKTAETDATKRALVTFGKGFGLALYSDRRRDVALGGEATSIPPKSGVPRPHLADDSVRGRVDKSALVLGEPKRVRDKGHLRFIASQPCVLCSRTPADAHHIRFAQPKAFGAKVSDEFTVPLCRPHHLELHSNGNERAWWHDMGVEPLPLAKRLWEESHRATDTDRTRGDLAPTRTLGMPD